MDSRDLAVAERLFVTFKVTRDGEAGHPMDHVLTLVDVGDDGSITGESLAVVVERLQREVRRAGGA